MIRSAAFFLLLLITSFVGFGQEEIQLKTPEFVISEVTHEFKIIDPYVDRGVGLVYLNKQPVEIFFEDFEADFSYSFSESGKQEVEILYEDQTFIYTPKVIPLWMSVLPPLVAILLALWIREVIVSLLLGIFFGAATIGWYTEGFLGVGKAFLSVLDKYLINTLNDWGHLAIILFTLLIGAMVAVISKNGGMQGVVDKLAKRANSPKSGMLTTWLLGIIIFFDDYANTLVVGNTMRPLTDKLKISREKLAYLVDSTAAPVASLAFITTWIGAELSYIQNGIDKIDGLGETESAYGIFFNSLGYSFYPIFTLFFMFWLILKQKDFGPMLKAEQAARKAAPVKNESEEENEFTIKKGLKPNLWNAILPVLAVVVVTGWGLVYTGSLTYDWNLEIGFFSNLSGVIGSADSFYALLWGSLVSIFLAVVMSMLNKSLKLAESLETAVSGIKSMMPAIIILVLAWGLASVTEEMHTADFITGLLRENVGIWIFPTLTFLLSAIVSFATGSSWGTMAILYPLFLPAAWQLGQDAGLEHVALVNLFSHTAATVLCGSVLGDHCSPISDTTILSSIASSCNHIDHVRTQLPYALTTGGVSIVFGTLLVALGVPSIFAFLIGFGAIIFIIKKFGKVVS